MTALKILTNDLTKLCKTRKIVSNLIDGLLPVLLGLRVAYLVDCMDMNEQLAVKVIAVLRKHSRNENMMALILSTGDRYMDQTFIVNEGLYRTEYGDDDEYTSPILAALPALYRIEGVAKDYLLQRMRAAMNTCLATANMEGSYVAVYPPEKSAPAPAQEPELPISEVSAEGEQRACSAPLPSVAIAGWLLEYPVVYWPTEGESSSSVLSGAQLRVWRVGIRKGEGETVSMQWSCPEWLHTATEADHESTHVTVWEELDRRHMEIGEWWRRRIGELESGCWELSVLKEWTGLEGGVILGKENRVQYGINL